MTSMLLTERMAPDCAVEVFSICAATAMLTPRRALPAPKRGERIFRSRRLVASLGALRPASIGSRIILGGGIDQGLDFGPERLNPVRALYPFGAVPLSHVSGVMAVVILA